ncbi:Zn finger protein [Squirrelpox virus]|uniref:Zn finger protein n=1 Tax=Squirrelpox virus TaxID=240426 RepID=U3UBL0_9POXV|nr:Zn finger protein [Squirrelpox virus]CCD83291.1 Zn finger protein [Squirrelpox virus]
MEDDAGSKRRRKRKPRTTVDETSDSACTTCSACHSRLLSVSDITKVPLDALRVAGSGSVLSCATCGSDLRPLSEFAR